MDTATKKPKVLLVDDDINLATLYKLRLEAEGFAVTYSTNGENALQMGRELRPDLIILDLMMPRLNGYDTLDMFRNTLETSGAKIVIMSALSQPDDIEKAKKLGADDYIIKSEVSINEVMSRLKSMLGITSDDLNTNDITSNA